MAATKCATQHQDAEERQPDSELSRSSRSGREREIPRDDVVIFSAFGANKLPNGPSWAPQLTSFGRAQRKQLQSFRW